MNFPSDHDLIAHALGHLDPPTRERVERALTHSNAHSNSNASPEEMDLADRYARIVAHLRSYDELEATPAPPFASLVLGPQARPARRERPTRAAWALGAAAALVVAGLALLLLLGGRSDTASIGRAGEGVEIVASPGPGTRPHRELRMGDVLGVAEPAEMWLGERVHVVLDTGTELELLGETEVRLRGGRAFFEVRPGPFTVRTAHGDVRVVGTTFEVALTEDGLGVRVVSGRVEVAGQSVEAGTTLEPTGVQPLGAGVAVGAWFRRPVLRLAVDDGAAPTGETALRFTFENPGRIPIEVAGPEGVTAALWLEVEDPAGVVHDVAVVSAASGAGPLPTGRPVRLGPRASQSFTLRFRRPFDAEGAYRCRAMYRPNGDSPLLSEVLLVEVR